MLLQDITVTKLFFRLETDIIVLRGHENGAASQVLRGAVVLCLPSALDIEYVYLQVTGQCKIRYLRIDPLEFGVKTNNHWS